MILGRIKPWWKNTSVWFMSLFCLTYKSIKMTFLMKGFFHTLEQQWCYCRSIISFQEPELYISLKNAFIRVRKHGFVRLTRRHFSIRTSELSEECFIGVKKMAAGSVGNSYQQFLSLTFAVLQSPKLHLCFPQIFLASQTSEQFLSYPSTTKI